MVRPRGTVIIGGQTFNVDAPVVTWRENGWDSASDRCIPTKVEPSPPCRVVPGGHEPYAVPPNPSGRPYLHRYALRPGLTGQGKNPSYEAVKAVVKQFVVHLDGCSSAEMCFNVLHNERGLSCHFLIDNDGTIFQTIDLGLMAYHAADWNLYSIGVELCNRGDAIKNPGYYAGGRAGPQRDTRNCRINGHTIKSFDYTPAQYDSFRRLCRDLLRLLPNLPAEYPQSSPGEQMWDSMRDAPIKRESYAGYIGHYHITPQKWDPGPFDFKEFCTKLRGAFCFPVFPKQEPAKDEDKPVVPDDGGDLARASAALYKLNEERADGGFFPVGPWGETKLWHGGVHVIGKPGGAVFAPYPGRLLAARMGKDSAIGSFNFVLLRHEMVLGPRKVQFYSLYMHLADELKLDKPVDWMTKQGWKDKGKPGIVVLLDEPIEAGALIGHVGKVGPDDLSRSQIHIEFFSEQLIDDPQWQAIDGSGTGRFCEAPEINALIDKNSDKLLSREELTSFFASGSGDVLHHMVPLHVSEWTLEPSWSESLIAAADFRDMKPAEIQAMVEEQITPGLWWDNAVATHCRLPRDGVVHHYHPVAFIAWFKNQLIVAAAEAARDGRNKIDEKDVREVPPTVTDDFGDKDGSSMRSASDVSEDPCNKSLTLEQMVQGFDAPECTP
jgi:N-acetylmuramoyl-L-alanine amidase